MLRKLLSIFLIIGVLTSTANANLASALYRDGYISKSLTMFELSGVAADTDEMKRTYANALFADGQTAKANEVLGIRSRSDPRIASVLDSSKPLYLTDINFIDPAIDYKLCVPAHFSLYKDEASDEFIAYIMSIGAVVETDGSYSLTLNADTLSGFIDDCRILSVSPDGETLLLRDSRAFWYTVNKNTIMLLAQTPNRGVKDEYNNLNWALHTQSFGNAPASVVWSHDSRYFTVTDIIQSLSKMKFNVDLFIFDTQTGEVFLGATYPNKASRGGSTVIQTVFDPTGESIYYILYGGQYDNRVALMKYDLITGVSTLCYNGEELAAYPKLCFDYKQQLMNIMDSNKMRDLSGLNVYSATPEGWVNSPVISQTPNAFGYSRWMDYSSSSGYGLLIRNNTMGSHNINLVSVFSANDNYAGLNKYIHVDGFDASKATLVDITEDNLLRSIETIDADKDELPSYKYKGVQIINAQLSPDGCYILLLVTSEYEYRLLVLDIDTLSLRQIEYNPDISVYSGFSAMESRGYPQGICWYNETNLIVNTKQGVKLMQITTQE